jgi:hypothetical protein
VGRDGDVGAAAARKIRSVVGEHVCGVDKLNGGRDLVADGGGVASGRHLGVG